MQTSWTPRFLISVSTASQNFAPSPPSPAHNPRMSRSPLQVDPDRHVDRPVGDLPVADLHHDRVDEHHRVHPVQRPVLPLGHLLDDLVGDPGDGVLADRRAVHVGEMRGDLPGRQPARGQRQHDLVDPVQPSLPLPHDPRLERAVPVPGHLDLDRADLGQHRLRPGAVAGVAAVAAGRVVLVIAQVLGDLRLQGGLQHRLGQPGQQAARADQLDPFGAGLLHQLLRELLLIQTPPVCHRTLIFSVMSGPSRQAVRVGVSGQISYTVDRTVPRIPANRCVPREQRQFRWAERSSHLRLGRVSGLRAVARSRPVWCSGVPGEEFIAALWATMPGAAERPTGWPAVGGES